MFQRAGCEEDGVGDQIEHEDGDALQIHDENLARQRRDHKEQRAQKEDLDNHDEQERLPVPPGVAAGDAGVIRPWGKRPGHFTEDHAGEGKDAGDE